MKVVLTLAIIAGVFFVYRSIRNYYYEKQLAEVIARLDTAEPGWQWENRFAGLPKLSKEKNAGEEIKAIMRLLTLDEYRAMLGTNQWCNEYVRYESLPTTELCKEFQRDHPNAQLIESYRDNIRKFLTASPCPEGLGRARLLKNYRAGLLSHKYRPILLLSGLPDVQPLRELVKLFSWNAALLMDANQPEAAADEVSNMLQISRIFDHDPFCICVLVRSALVQISAHATHRLLAQTSQLSSGTLKRLQDEFLREETLMISLPEVYRWERAMHDHDLKLLHGGEYSLANYLELHGNLYSLGATITTWPWLDTLLKKAYPAIVLGFWAEPRHYALERSDQLLFYDKIITWASSPEHQLLDNFKSMQKQGDGVSPFVYKLQNLYGNAFSYESYKKESYLGIDRIARAMLSYRAHCRCIATALACERYRIEYGTWPAAWEQLSPKYLPTTLLDPFTGKPLFLKTLPDGLMIYSVGYNGIDDGGRIFPTDKQYYGDIGYRLWNPNQRRVDMSKEWKAIEEEFKGNNE